MVKSLLGKVLVGAAVVAVGGLASPALAGAEAPAMDPVVFPLDVTSVVTEIAAAGGIMLSAVFGIAIGFALIRKLFRRVTAAV